MLASIHVMEWGYILAGLFVGMMVGMTGVGGGSLMTPILIFGFAIQPVVAVGTDLLFAAATKAGGIWAYMKHGLINWQVVLRLAYGSVPATILTLIFLQQAAISEDAISDLITTALGIALILTSSALLLKGVITKQLKARKGHPFVTALYYLREDNKQKVGVTVVIGILLGVMVTMSSVGAGALGAVTLLFLYPKLSGSQVVATDIAHAVPLTLIAGIGHSTAGTVDWSLLFFLLMGSLPGIYIGSLIGVKIPEQVMRALLATILLGVGIKCLL
jgi:uncharacterized membrane protein YfcA